MGSPEDVAELVDAVNENASLESIHELLEFTNPASLHQITGRSALHEAAENGKLRILYMLLMVSKWGWKAVSPVAVDLVMGSLEDLKAPGAECDTEVLKGPPPPQAGEEASGDKSPLHKAKSPKSAVLPGTPSTGATEGQNQEESPGSGLTERPVVLQGVDMQHRRNGCRTPLHHAAMNNHSDCATLLLRFGAEVSALNSRLETAAHIAAGKNYTQLAGLLLKHPTADGVAASTDIDGSSILHSAARNSDVPLTKFVLKYNVPHDVQDNDGCTPLHAATGKCCLPIVEILLAAGADPDTVNKKGQTALDIANDNGDAGRESAQLIQEAVILNRNMAQYLVSAPQREEQLQAHISMLRVRSQKGQERVDEMTSRINELKEEKIADYQRDNVKYSEDKLVPAPRRQRPSTAPIGRSRTPSRGSATPSPSIVEAPEAVPSLQPMDPEVEKALAPVPAEEDDGDTVVGPRGPPPPGATFQVAAVEASMTSTRAYSVVLTVKAEGHSESSGKSGLSRSMTSARTKQPVWNIMPTFDTPTMTEDALNHPRPACVIIELRDGALDQETNGAVAPVGVLEVPLSLVVGVCRINKSSGAPPVKEWWHPLRKDASVQAPQRIESLEGPVDEKANLGKLRVHFEHAHIETLRYTSYITMQRERRLAVAIEEMTEALKHMAQKQEDLAETIDAMEQEKKRRQAFYQRRTAFGEYSKQRALQKRRPPAEVGPVTHKVSNHLKDRHPYQGPAPYDELQASYAYGHRGVPRLIEILSHSDLSVPYRRNASEFLLKHIPNQEVKFKVITDPSSVSLLVSLARDDDSEVRTAMCNILGSLATIMQGRDVLAKNGALTVLSERLSDLSVAVRKSAGMALNTFVHSLDGQRLCTLSSGGVVVISMVNSLADESQDVSSIIVHGIVSISRQDGAILPSLRAGIVPKLVHLLEQGVSALDTLSSLLNVCANPQGKQDAIDNNAVPVVASFLESEDDEARRLAIACIMAITINEEGIRVVMDHCIPVIVKCLYDSNKEIAKVTTKTVRNICSNPAGRRLVMTQLKSDVDMYRRVHWDLLKNLSSDLYSRGLKFEDITFQDSDTAGQMA